MPKAVRTTKTRRSVELRRMLEERLYELSRDVHGRMREARVESVDERRSIDQGEASELESQDELEFALLQMKTETVNQLDAALRRLEEGTYGRCCECGDDIGEARLRALPFAVRCKDCEELRELAEARDRHLALRRAAPTPFFD